MLSIERQLRKLRSTPVTEPRNLEQLPKLGSIPAHRPVDESPFIPLRGFQPSSRRIQTKKPTPKPQPDVDLLLTKDTATWQRMECTYRRSAIGFRIACGCVELANGSLNSKQQFSIFIFVFTSVVVSWFACSQRAARSLQRYGLRDVLMGYFSLQGALLIIQQITLQWMSTSGTLMSSQVLSGLPPEALSPLLPTIEEKIVLPILLREPYMLAQGIVATTLNCLFYLGLFSIGVMRWVRATVTAAAHLTLTLLLALILYHPQLEASVVIWNMAISMVIIGSSAIAGRTAESATNTLRRLDVSFRRECRRHEKVLSDHLPREIVQQLREQQAGRITGYTTSQPSPPPARSSRMSTIMPSDDDDSDLDSETLSRIGDDDHEQEGEEGEEEKDEEVDEQQGSPHGNAMMATKQEKRLVGMVKTKYAHTSPSLISKPSIANNDSQLQVEQNKTARVRPPLVRSGRKGFGLTLGPPRKANPKKRVTAKEREKLLSKRKQQFTRARSTSIRDARMLNRKDTVVVPECVIANYFPDVTVLFCYIADFSTIVSGRTGGSLVALVNRVFTEFDDLIGNRPVYKVEALVETYLVVGGCPTANPKHAANVCELALAMSAKATSGALGRHIRLKIGIHSGPVVAGFVGRSASKYQLFGDTMNTASRMCSTCPPDHVQISASTYELVKNCSQFELIKRGEIPVKGKGVMTTHYVEVVSGPSPTASSAVAGNPMVAGGRGFSRWDTRPGAGSPWRSRTSGSNASMSPLSRLSVGSPLNRSGSTTVISPPGRSTMNSPPNSPIWQRTPIKQQPTTFIPTSPTSPTVTTSSSDDGGSSDADDWSNNSGVDDDDGVMMRLVASSSPQIPPILPSSSKALSPLTLKSESGGLHSNNNKNSNPPRTSRNLFSNPNNTNNKNNKGPRPPSPLRNDGVERDNLLGWLSAGVTYVKEAVCPARVEKTEMGDVSRDTIPNVRLERKFIAAMRSGFLRNASRIFALVSLFFLLASILLFAQALVSPSASKVGPLVMAVVCALYGLGALILYCRSRGIRPAVEEDDNSDSVEGPLLPNSSLFTLGTFLTPTACCFLLTVTASNLYLMWSVGNSSNNNDTTNDILLRISRGSSISGLHTLCAIVVALNGYYVRVDHSYFMARFVLAITAAIFCAGFLSAHVAVSQQRHNKELRTALQLVGRHMAMQLALAGLGMVLGIAHARREARSLRVAYLQQLARKQERGRCQGLLNRILPHPSLAQPLLRGRQVVMNLADVTYLHSDLVNFTSLCGVLTPGEVVQLLNELYSAFDIHLDQRGVHKIDTIGDAFVVVGGLFPNLPESGGNSSESEGSPAWSKTVTTTTSFLSPPSSITSPPNFPFRNSNPRSWLLKLAAQTTGNLFSPGQSKRNSNAEEEAHNRTSIQGSAGVQRVIARTMNIVEKKPEEEQKHNNNNYFSHTSNTSNTSSTSSTSNASSSNSDDHDSTLPCTNTGNQSSTHNTFSPLTEAQSMQGSGSSSLGSPEFGSHTGSASGSGGGGVTMLSPRDYPSSLFATTATTATERCSEDRSSTATMAVPLQDFPLSPPPLIRLTSVGFAGPNHVNQVLLFALDMIQALEKLKGQRDHPILAKARAHGMELGLRIGVHSGKGVGAFLGVKRPRFTVWGHDTLVSQKLESTGTPGCIHISADTLKLCSLDLPALGLTASYKGVIELSSDDNSNGLPVKTCLLQPSTVFA